MFKKSLRTVGTIASSLALVVGLSVSPSAMASDPFIAQITMFGGNFAPRGWAFCNGQLLAISSNSALFSLLGTTYGGDGRTTFGLPDLRGRVAIHHGSSTGPGLSSYRLGEKGGAETVTLTTNQMPSHTHVATTTIDSIAVTLKGNNGAGNSNTPGGNGLASKSRTNIYSSNAPDVAMHADSIAATATASTTVNGNGSSQSHNNLMPYQTVNYIIALVGIFPSRN